MTKYIPGNPTFIVQNMAGAGDRLKILRSAYLGALKDPSLKIPETSK